MAVAEITCQICGICFGAPQTWLTARMASKEPFYCPNGHPMSYKTSEHYEIRGQRDQLRLNVEFLKTEITKKDRELERLKEKLERPHREKQLRGKRRAAA